MNILRAAGEFLTSVADAITKSIREIDVTAEASHEDDIREEAVTEEFQDAANDELPPSQSIRATIKSARREMDPVTLQGWSRVIFACEDGEERKMYFPGDNGIYLTAGEDGLLEHRDGAFVSFEKDSGEIVGALYHILPEEE